MPVMIIRATQRKRNSRAGVKESGGEEADRPLAGGTLTGTVDNESRQREDEQQFAQFGWLESEEWKFK